MADVVKALKAMKPDEPDEDIVKAVSAIRQQNPTITDDQIIEQAQVMVKGGKPDFSQAPTMPAAPPSPAGPPTMPPGGGPDLPAPAGPPAGGPGPGMPPPVMPLFPAGPPPSASVDQPAGLTGKDAAIAALQGLAGMGDALSAGYGGVKTDNLKTALTADQQALENRRTGKKAGIENAAAEKSASDLKALQDPTSQMSKQRQDSARPLLLAAGYKPEEITKIPGGILDDTLKDAISFADAKARLAELKMNHDFMVSSKQAEVGLEEKKLKQTAEEAEKERRLKHPIMHFLGLEDDGKGADTASGFSPDVEAYAKAHSITPEQAQAIKNKRTAGRG